jgi:hypothetical protein
VENNKSSALFQEIHKVDLQAVFQLVSKGQDYLMLKNIGDYFDGNTAEVNADARSSDDIAYRSVLKTANIKQISKSVSSGIALMLL